MANIEHWTIVPQPRGAAIALEGHDLEMRPSDAVKSFEVVPASQLQGAVDRIAALERALVAAAERLDDMGHPEGAHEAREVLDPSQGGQ
jgi:hypothetical protein